MPHVELLTNGEKSPIGIERDTVFFSWRYLSDSAFFLQTAYRIQVSSCEDFTRQDNVLWDSGWIHSANNLYHSCDSTLFPPITPLYWTVTLRAHSGEEEKCGTARFILRPERWQAQWIWKGGSEKVNEYAGFRRVFHISENVQDACLFVSAHSHYALYLNGSRVGGFISPSPTNPMTDQRYLVYDIAPLLKQGDNRIEAVVLYLGGGGQNYVDSCPGFFCETHIWTEAGRQCIASDEDWQCTAKTPFEEGMPYQQNRGITASEHFDGRFHPRDAQWENAVLCTDNPPEMPVRRQMIPEGAIENLLVPKLLSHTQDTWVYDVGYIVSGWPVLRLREQEGTKICVRYSENLNEQGRVGHNVANETSENYCDWYTMGNRKAEEWQPCFSYKAFRYLEVTGCRNDLQSDSVRVAAAHTDLHCTGSFSCDNALLNRIFDACIQTQKNNMLGQLVDCPHREQAQYLADSDRQAETLLYYFENTSIVEKVLSDFSQAQQPDGSFPFVYPSNFQKCQYSLQIPEWDTHFCTLCWNLYQATGEKRVLRQYYDVCCRSVQRFLNEMDRSYGLVRKSEAWHISDWPYPNVDHNGDFLTAENMEVFRCLTLLEQIARLLEKSEDAEKYQSEAVALREAIRKNLLNTEKNLFCDSLGSQHCATGINAMALCWSLFNPEETADAAAWLADRPLESSTLLTLDVLRALFSFGHGDRGYELLSSTQKPGWGSMLVNGGRTMWEGFSDIESHCHAWNAYPARIFAERLVGIQCTAPGFREVQLKPYFPEGMHELKASVQTPQGILSVEWKLDHGNYILNTSIPYGVQVQVYVPDSKSGYVYQGTLKAENRTREISISS